MHFGVNLAGCAPPNLAGCAPPMAAAYAKWARLRHESQLCLYLYDPSMQEHREYQTTPREITSTIV